MKRLGDVGIIGMGGLGEQLAKMLMLRPKITVIGSVRNPIRRNDLIDKFGKAIYIKDTNKEVIEKADAIILAVKPGQIKSVCLEIAEYVPVDMPIISVAAAIPLNKLEEWLPKSKMVIRCMPNIACSIGSGYAGYYSKSISAENIMREIFGTNEIERMKNDEQMDATTLIAGCGPAFFSWYIECLKKVGENIISPEILNKMIISTMMGTGDMLERYTTNEIIRTVASPKGATEAALTSLNTNQIDEKIQSAINIAQKRIETLAKTC